VVAHLIRGARQHALALLLRTTSSDAGSMTAGRCPTTNPAVESVPPSPTAASLPVWTNRSGKKDAREVSSFDEGIHFDELVSPLPVGRRSLGCSGRRVG